MARIGSVLGGFVLLLSACSQTEPRSARTGGTTAVAGGGEAAMAGAGAAGASGTGGDDQGGGAGATGGIGGTSGVGGAGVGGNAGETSGGAGDAGASSDASVEVASSEAGTDASGGCPYNLCETFSGPAPGAAGSAWLIDVDKSGTVVETVADKGRTDSHSLHLKVSATAGIHGYVTETQSLAATGASFWGRVFIWYAVDTPSGHIVNVAVDGKLANGMTDQVRIVNVIGNHIATNRRSDDMGKGSNVVPPHGKWSCYEWHLTPSTLDVYLDGTKLPISETWTEPTLSLVRLGFERFTAGVAGDLWLDDIAIDANQIGCH